MPHVDTMIPFHVITKPENRMWSLPCSIAALMFMLGDAPVPLRSMWRAHLGVRRSREYCWIMGQISTRWMMREERPLRIAPNIRWVTCFRLFTNLFMNVL
jgi:hypothetical protein